MKLKKKTASKLASLTALLAALVLPVSCGGGDDDKKSSGNGDKKPGSPAPKKSADEDPGPPGSGGTILGTNKHFQETVSHVDVGGQVFHYMDIDGDMAKAATMADDLMGQIFEISGNQIPPELANIKLHDILFETGLVNVKAIAMSSYETNGIYHNKLYAHIPGGREGLLKSLGGKPGPLISQSLAPADAVAVFEHDVNLKPILEVVTKIVEKVGNEEMKSSFSGGLASQAAGIGISVGDLFGKLNSKLTIIVSTHPTKTLAISQEPEITVPEFDVLIAMDNIGWLVDQLEKTLPPDAISTIEKGNGYKRLASPEPAGPGPFEIYKPVFHFDEKADRLLIASRVEYLDRCLSASAPRLSAQAEYTSLTRDLPTEGNGFYYVSKKFWSTYLNIIKSLDPNTGGQVDTMFQSSFFKSMWENGMAQVDVNLDRGWLAVSNAPQSHKGTLLGLALAPYIGGAAIVGALVMPQMADELGGAGAGAGAEIRAQSDLKAIEVGLQSYLVNSGRGYPTTAQGLDALVQKPTAKPLPKRWAQIMATLPRDPWGNPYLYRSPGVKNPGKFDIWSKGADRIEGSPDDIGNWRP